MDYQIRGSEKRNEITFSRQAASSEQREKKASGCVVLCQPTDSEPVKASEAVSSLRSTNSRLEVVVARSLDAENVTGSAFQGFGEKETNFGRREKDW